MRRFLFAGMTKRVKRGQSICIPLHCLAPSFVLKSRRGDGGVASAKAAAPPSPTPPPPKINENSTTLLHTTDRYRFKPESTLLVTHPTTQCAMTPPGIMPRCSAALLLCHDQTTFRSSHSLRFTLLFLNAYPRRSKIPFQLIQILTF